MADFYDDVLFPESIALRSFSGKVMRKSRRAMTEDGTEQRIALWGVSLRSYEAGMVPRPLEEWQAMEDVFELCDSTIGFLLRDRHDYQVAQERGAFVSISATVYAFQKQHRIGDRATYRGIAKPEEGTITVYRSRNGNAPTKLPPSSYSIDYANGRIAFTPGTIGSNDVPSWSGQFFVPVRFEDDDIGWETVDRSQGLGLLIAGPSVPLREMRWPGMPYRPPEVIGPPPAPLPPTLARFREPPAFGVLTNLDRTLSHGTASFQRAQATGDIPAAFSGSGTPSAGFAAEFTIEHDPPAQIRTWVGLNFTTAGSQECYAFFEPNNGGAGWSINISGGNYANPGSAAGGGAWSMGDRIGVIVYANNDAATNLRVAFFRNGVLLGKGVISAAVSQPIYFSANAQTGSTVAAGQITVETDIAAMTHAAVYKAFRESGIAMLDAGSWAA